VPFKMASPWYRHPGFIAAIDEKVKAGLAEFEGRRPFVIFSAHSLPVAHIEDGDPYVEEIQATVEEVVRRVGDVEHTVAYQSKGHTPEPWLGPQVEEVMDELAGKGAADVLLVPVGFVSDHMETLYDIDVLAADKASSLGLNFKRTESLNDSPAFIAALADIIVDTLG
jgi:protoporphyrin/coproporphyrin ferrochelatase